MREYVEIHDVIYAINQTYSKWMNDMLEDKEDEETLREVLQDVINAVGRLQRYE